LKIFCLGESGKDKEKVLCIRLVVYKWKIYDYKIVRCNVNCIISPKKNLIKNIFTFENYSTNKKTKLKQSTQKCNIKTKKSEKKLRSFSSVNQKIT